MRSEITQEDLEERRDIANRAFEEIKAGEAFGVVGDKFALTYEKVVT
ncbi:MAG: hypothetical protein LBF15_01955 [Candidatus Peribacteria bacterium]|nr:hypothetical protein [Candidatus Peribacteria bacterium]